MRELRIELPDYRNRQTDANTIALIAERFGLGYDAVVNPILSVIDTATEEVILTSSGIMLCHVSGDDESIGKFLEELKLWIE